MFEELKHNFLRVCDLIGLDYRLFSDARLSELADLLNQIQHVQLQELEANNVDTDELSFVIDGASKLLVKYSATQDTSERNRLFTNLKVLMNQVNSQVQEFVL